jgi:hypothetical protein
MNNGNTNGGNADDIIIKKVNINQGIVENVEKENIIKN